MLRNHFPVDLIVWIIRRHCYASRINLSLSRKLTSIILPSFGLNLPEEWLTIHQVREVCFTLSIIIISI